MKFPAEPLIKDKKSVLLKVAEELFAIYGLEGTSTRMIAEQSGINLAMINYYFGSKDALYAAIFENRLVAIIQEIERVGRLTLAPAEKLETYLRGYIQRIQNHQGFYRMESRQLTMLEQPPVVDLVNASRTKAFLLISTIIENGVSTGVFRKVDVAVFALNILYLLPTLFTRPDSLFIQLGFTENHDSAVDTVENRVINFLMSSLII